VPYADSVLKKILSVIKGLGGGLSHPGNYATTAITVLFRGEVGSRMQASSRSAFELFVNDEIHKIFKTFM